MDVDVRPDPCLARAKKVCSAVCLDTPPRPVTVLLTEGNLQSAAASLRAGTMLFPVPAALLTQFPIDNILAQFGRADSRIRLDLVGEDELR